MSDVHTSQPDDKFESEEENELFGFKNVSHKHQHTSERIGKYPWFRCSLERVHSLSANKLQKKKKNFLKCDRLTPSSAVV